MDNGNTTGNPQISLGNAGPNSDQMGSGGAGNPYREGVTGYTGPGKGSATKLNSDDQMPCPPAGC